VPPIHRIVVLGAAGFLGQSMVKRLAREKVQVVAFWRRPIPELLELPNVESVIGDVRDAWILADALQGADIVYHFASATHPNLFFRNPAAEYWEALQPLMVLMETAARARVRRMVFPSSGGTIYTDREAPRTEDSRVDPLSPYAIFKLAAEQLLMHAARQGDFAVDIYRIGNPYGPDQRPRPGQGVLPHWIQAIRQHQHIRIFGDGTAERDYIFVDDVCELLTHACRSETESDIFNIGTGIPTSLNQLLEQIQQLLGRAVAADHVPNSAASLDSIALSAHKILQYFPGFQFVPLRTGLATTLRAHGLLNEAEPTALAADRPSQPGSVQKLG
jgi:UDP-glucose 4-epimerase